MVQVGYLDLSNEVLYEVLFAKRKKNSLDNQQLKDTVSYLPSAAARHHGIRRPLRLVLPLCNAAHAAAVTLKSSMYCRVGRNVEEKGVSAAAALLALLTKQPHSRAYNFQYSTESS